MMVGQAELTRESHKLIQELIAVSLYCISYLRDLFPENHYSDYKYYDTTEPTSDSNFILTKNYRETIMLK